MTKSKSAIGHFARIPLHVARADVSETAKAVWREMAFLGSPEKPVVFVRQSDFAAKLNCCTKTIQRALKELVAAELLSFAGWLWGRYKQYKMKWQNFLDSARQICPTTLDMNVQRPETLLSADPGHSCPPKTEFAEQSTKQFSCATTALEQQAEMLLEQHEPEYRERFPCLDGRSARPTLKACITQALNHNARHNYKDLKVYLDMWLQNAAHKWHMLFVKEVGVLVRTPQERAAEKEWERKRYEWNQREAAKLREKDKAFWAQKEASLKKVR